MDEFCEDGSIRALAPTPAPVLVAAAVPTAMRDETTESLLMLARSLSVTAQREGGYGRRPNDAAVAQVMCAYLLLQPAPRVRRQEIW